MNKALFWTMMEKAKHVDTEQMYDNLTAQLSTISAEDEQLFRGYIGAYMECINECIWVDMACKVINGYVSDDTGLYFTLWLIAQGEKTLLHTIADPDSLSTLEQIPFGEAEFELLMMVGLSERTDYGALADVQQKCVEEIQPTIVYKGNGKCGGYDDFAEAMADIPKVLPELVKRAAKENFAWKHAF